MTPNDRRLDELACINTAVDETYTETGWDFIDLETDTVPLLSWHEHLAFLEQRLTHHFDDVFGGRS